MPGDDIAVLEARLRKIESEARDREALDLAKAVMEADDGVNPDARRLALERVKTVTDRALQTDMERIRRKVAAYCAGAGQEVNATTEALVSFVIGRALEGDELREAINTPQIADFLEAAKNEAIHQRERWGVEHDAGKRVEDWVALFQYLLGKLVRAHWRGDQDKLLHHVITVGAVALNMHANLTGDSTAMRPGIGPLSVRAAMDDPRVKAGTHLIRWTLSTGHVNEAGMVAGRMVWRGRRFDGWSGWGPMTSASIDLNAPATIEEP